MYSIIKSLKNNHGKAESKAPTILLLLVLALAGFLAFKFVPVKIRSMKFESDLQDIMQSNLQKYEKRTTKNITERIQKKANELGLPKLVEQKNIITKELDDGRFTVTVKYNEEVNIPVYGTYIWPFEFKSTEVR